MASITEAEFEKLVDGIVEDRESIFKHNPRGSEEESLLWMLMCCLINYLGVDDSELPCFPGSTGAETYRQAIDLIVSKAQAEKFDISFYLLKLRNL